MPKVRPEQVAVPLVLRTVEQRGWVLQRDGVSVQEQGVLQMEGQCMSCQHLYAMLMMQFLCMFIGIWQVSLIQSL